MLTTTQSVSEAGGSGLGPVGELGAELGVGGSGNVPAVPLFSFLIYQGLELWWHRCGDGP